ncbi:hypothetical protein C8J57DRAFT_1509033 [Mycena rebaudengoi]|nr:hypothetical protein C8J57DRAFT_1509033 [Mycena rebaudengoi]
MSLPPLPTEVVELIIDYAVSESPISAQRLSLVSTQWLPRSRYYLFACITLGFRAQCMRLQNVTAFLALLAPPSRPTFIPYVRDVTLSRWMPNANWGLIPAHILDALSTAGIRPTRLHIDHCSPIPPAPIRFSFLLMGYSNSHRKLIILFHSPALASTVHRLDLTLPTHTLTLPALIAHLRAFPHLAHLSIDASYGFLPARGPPPAHFLPPLLHTLELCGGGAVLLGWLASFRSAPPALATVALRLLQGLDAQEEDALRRFLASRVAGRLRTLTYEDCDVKGDDLELRTLAALPKLHQLVRVRTGAVGRVMEVL